MPSIASACWRASSGERASFTPPPLPRPPAWICAFTAEIPPPSWRAAPSASSGVTARYPRGTATPNFRRISFAWYSWIFTRSRSSSAPARRWRRIQPRPPWRDRQEAPGPGASLGGPRPGRLSRGPGVRSPRPRRSELRLGDRLLHGVDGLREHRALLVVQLELDHPLDAGRADHHRHPDEEPLLAVLTVEVRRAREDALLVAQVALRHRDRRRGRRVEGRPGAEERHDLAAPLARALEDRVELRLVEQLRERRAVHGRVPQERHHVVAVAA